MHSKMNKILVVVFCLTMGLTLKSQNLTFTQYNVVNINTMTLDRTVEYVNDIGAIRVHEVVDNILNVSRTDVENWITTNFVNVNTNAFILSSGDRIVTTGETSVLVAGNTETLKLDFAIVEIGSSFYFNLKGKVGNLSNLTSTDMSDIEIAVNGIYASFVNTVQ